MKVAYRLRLEILKKILNISARQHMYDQISETVEARRNSDATTEGGRLFIDELVDIAKNEKELRENALTYVIGGFHTTGTLMAWLIYYLSLAPEEIQSKVRRELLQVLGDSDFFGEAATQLKSAALATNRRGLARRRSV